MISHAAVANPRLGIDVVVAESHVRVRVCGELDYATAPLLNVALDVIVDRGCRHLVLDFGELEFFSSAGWNLVADVARRLELLDGSVEVRTVTSSWDSAGFARSSVPSQTRRTGNAVHRPWLADVTGPLK